MYAEDVVVPKLHMNLGSPGSFQTDAAHTNDPLCVLDRTKVTKARKIVVKVGTAVVSRASDGRLALGRIGNLIEQIEVLARSGRQVILVTSGSVGAGRQRIRREQIFNSSPLELQSFNQNNSAQAENIADIQKRAAAACGQSGLMALYDLLFSHMDLACSQLLITRNDFLSSEFRAGLTQTVDHLLKMNVIPVFNENDAISYHSTSETQEELKATGRFWDNDSLAMILAKQLQADLLVCLTDVEGLFDAAPDLPDSKLIPTYSPAVHDKIIKFGAKSTMGRGGMSSKVSSAWGAAQAGVTTLIVNGKGFRPALVEAVSGEVVGTLFDVDAAERVRKEHKHVEHRCNSEEQLLRKMAAEEDKKDTMTVHADDFAAATDVGEQAACNPDTLVPATEGISISA